MDNRHLDFNAFVAQRANQIANFTSILEVETRKKGHQSLPKSIRRRAMSHNRYRIPFRLRRPMEEQLIKSEMMQRIPKCRKNIRKSRLLLTSYKKRSQRQKWLSTHLWSVKRMEMMDYHGYKIAYKPKDKCFRSAYRHFRHNACLMDFSYLQCIVFDIKEKQKFAHISYENQPSIHRFSQVRLMDQYEHLICPAFAFEESETIIRCFYDPCCSEQIHSTKWEHAEIRFEKSVEFYLLLGPESLNRISQALEALQLLEKAKKEQFFSLKMRPNQLMLIGESCKQKIINRPLISKPHECTIAQNYSESANDILRKQFYKNIQLSKQKSQASESQISSFWKHYKEKQERQHQNYESFKDIFKVTTRSKYTHKRRSKVTKQVKKKILKNEEDVKQQIEKQVKQMQAEQKTPTVQIEEQKFFGPFLISWFRHQKSFNGIFQGCIVLCGNENKSQFWRNLARTNVKIIGRRQYLHCLLESGIKAFPNDYHQTKSFQFFNDERTKSLKVQNLSKPPQKRINFTKISSPSPFSFVVPHVSAYSVRILMVSGGRCFSGSYICKLTADDLANAEKQLGENSCIRKLEVQDEKDPENKKQFLLGETKEVDKPMEGIKTKREIIGFVTSGGYLFSQCREGGIGFVESEEMVGSYVLIRKASSRFYFLAQTFEAQI